MELLAERTDIDTIEFSKNFFVGFGAARAGTTWISAVLKQHPDIQMTKVKEVHYFNWALLKPETTSTPMKALLAAKRILLRPAMQETLLNRFYHNNRLRRILLREQPNTEWYVRLFSDAPDGAVCGEFTPAYATLPEELIREIGNLFPHVRIIFIMRNPVERLWSHYRYQIGKGVMTPDEIVSKPDEFFAGRTNYIETISKLEKCFSRDQIFYGYYEDFVDEPQKHFDDLCAFLGVSSSTAAMQEMFSKQINAAKQDDACPDDLRDAFSEQYKSLTPFLQKKLGRVPNSWLR